MITKIHGLYVTLPTHILMLLLVQPSMSIPRHIYSATRDPLFSIVTENVANASLEPIIDKYRRSKKFGQWTSSAWGQIAECFCFQNVPLAQGVVPPILQPCLSHDTQRTVIQQPLAFEMFIIPALSVLPKFTEN